MKKYSDEKILNSWGKNIDPWVNAVRKGQIESRILITDQAIVKELLKLNPKIVLDIGCGEGWLVRYLMEKGIKAVGIDGVEGLIQKAKAKGGDFHWAKYEDLYQFKIQEKFDTIVCNFSLIGERSTESVLEFAPNFLGNCGNLIIQTLHPDFVKIENPDQEGWRAGSWDGFDKSFKDPAPWYFRPLRNWKELFKNYGYSLVKIVEPIHTKTKVPASIIFVLKRMAIE